MPAPIRRLRLSDAMILVAAAAAGLAWSRFLASLPEWLGSPFMEAARPAFGANMGGPDLSHRPLFRLASACWKGALWTVPALVSGAFGVLVLRLRRPRPAWRRIALLPGTVACLAVAVSVGLSALRLGVGVILARESEADSVRLGATPSAADWWWPLYDLIRPSEIGMVIAISWLILAVAGRFRPEPSAIDRLGRGVGAACVSWMFLAWICSPS